MANESFSLTDEDRTWLRQHCIQKGIKKSELMRDLVTRYRRETESLPEATDTRSEKERFLDAVREHLGPHLAAYELGISIATVKDWQKDPDFVEQLNYARQAGIERVQSALVQKAVDKKDTMAAGWLLNAQHELYARAKKSTILSILEPYLKRLRLVLQEELGSDSEAAIKRAFERMRTIQRKMLSKT